MSVVHVRHIEKALTAMFKDHVDMSDYNGTPNKKHDDAFMSRCQAAYALVMLADLTPEIAGAAITDSFHDNGIDALLFQHDESVLYIIQSKWHSEGKGTVQLGDIHTYGKCIKDLIDADFSNFNAKVKKRKSEIEAALDDTAIRFVFVVVHTGSQPLAQNAKRPLSDLIVSLNDTSNIASMHEISQLDLHQSVAAQAEGASIKLEVMLHEWGQAKSPYPSYYGQIEAEDIGKWWGQFGQLLFVRNLRKFTGKTDVNDGIMETLNKDPSKFWYFNNGITVLCSRLKKKAIGGSKRTSGVFSCEGLSIVNGAQTVGCIGEAYKKSPQLIQQARVNIRFISTSNAPESFSNDLTRAANTQNRIERRDFAALDPEQDRLRRELYLENGKLYSYKSGDAQPPPGDGCSIDETTISLACAHSDPSLAVQAKREVGKLWEDVTRPPYRLLFNSSVNALNMWRTVEVMRIVDSTLKEVSVETSGRERLIAVHGNRLVLHLVFRHLARDKFDEPNFDMRPVKDEAVELTRKVLAALIEGVELKYANAYPNSLFKNATKCKDVAEYCIQKL